MARVVTLSYAFSQSKKDHDGSLHIGRLHFTTGMLVGLYAHRCVHAAV